METVLTCDKVTKYYGNKPALGGVSVSVQSGRIVGLLGPNGSGKTTLIKCITGLLCPKEGKISVCGKEIGEESKALVSYLPDRIYFDDSWTVEALLTYYCDFYADFDRARAERLLADLGIETDMKIRQLSKGNQEKMQLIFVMSRRAKLYVLDEPIAGVDPAARDYILNTVFANYDRSASILISTHLISDIETVLDEYIFLQNGVVAMQGSVRDVHEQMGRTLDSLFREVFRC